MLNCVTTYLHINIYSRITFLVVTMSTDENYTEDELEIQREVIEAEQQQVTVPKSKVTKEKKLKGEQQVKEEEEDTPITVDLELENLDGIGKETAAKLRSYGIHDIAALALSQAGELVETLSNGGANKNVSLDSCSKLVLKAHNYMTEKGILNKPLTSSKVLLEKNTVRKRFSTGDKALDDQFFGGGIESKSVTEFYGAFGSGKTQLCYSTLTLAASQGRKVLFIDTENTYSPERVDQICMLKGYDTDVTQNNILVLSPPTVSVFVSFIRQLEHFIHDNKIELIVVDSIIALHKSEYIGRGLLAPKQQNLTQIMSKLIRTAQHYDCGVIITNHIIANPDPYTGGGSELAAGGNSIAHYSTHRIYLQKKGMKKRYTALTMVDSPRYPPTQILMELKEEGVVFKDPKDA